MTDLVVLEQECDAAVERWLREEAVTVYDAMPAGPTQSIPAERVGKRLRSHHASPRGADD